MNFIHIFHGRSVDRSVSHSHFADANEKLLQPINSSYTERIVGRRLVGGWLVCILFHKLPWRKTIHLFACSFLDYPPYLVVSFRLFWSGLVWFPAPHFSNTTQKNPIMAACEWRICMRILPPALPLASLVPPTGVNCWK